MIEIISIVIRAKDEDEWIGACLLAISQQKIPFKLEVILVDNGSIDETISIANKFGVKLINYDDEVFNYSKALNKGFETATGDIIVCLSAHCIPVNRNWLSELVKPFNDINVVASYGRQLPTLSSEPIDRRDLLTVFGVEDRYQAEDFFFHNANSAIRKTTWNAYQFDENIHGLEDRFWAKKILSADCGSLAYCSRASVYHQHGLNQSNDPDRVVRIVRLLDDLFDDGN
jgi:glycosyltransferase involved in cell wall biosynthesis